MKTLASMLFLSMVPLLAAAQTPAAPQQRDTAKIVVQRAGAPRWAIAIHGGAGTIPKTLPEERKQQYLTSLAAALKVGGLTNKRFGRLGDVPIIGAGTYANNHTCAISATGIGEQFIRHTVAHDISALMEYAGLTLQQAAERVIRQKLQPGDGGVIGVSHDGSLALVFNSEGMYRGAADSAGRFEVKIWE